jgi:tetratricopeptide (TPR) repeat protein
MLRFEQAREIGWYHEARAALEEVLRSGRRERGARRGGDESGEETFDRALGHLLQLYVDAHHYDGAAAVLEAYLPLARGTVSVHLQAARVYERRGATEAALDAIRRALAAEPPTATTRLEGGALLLRLGAFAEAGAMYQAVLGDEAVAPRALQALARLCLWRGDAEGALGHAERLRAHRPDSPIAQRIAAAVRVLQGDPAGALPMLDAVLRDDSNDAEAYAWRAEAHLRLGHRDEALADAQRSPPGSSHSFAARALHVLAALAPESAPSNRPSGTVSERLGALPSSRRRRGPAGDLPRPPTSITAHARHELAGELTAIDPRAAEILASDDASALAALLERALVAMRGNRTPLATWVRADGRLARLPHSTSARVASRQALELIKVATPEETLQQFDVLIAQRPESSMPLVHRGELHLWLGRYAEARADLEGAIAVHRQTRWAWYGLACLDLLAGDPARALDTCAYGIRVMDDTEGPVAFSYRGEAYRLLGRLEEAGAQLAHACELHPRRLSAWINLALVHGAAGNEVARRDVFRRLAVSAPSLLSQAAAELGDGVFEQVVLKGPQSEVDSCSDGETIDRLLRHVLAMMRGNRSSSCVTYFTSDGELRHVPQGQRRDPDATLRSVSRIRQVLRKAIERRRMPPH